MDHSLAGGVTLLRVTFTSHQRRLLTRFAIHKIVHRLITDRTQGRPAPVARGPAWRTRALGWRTSSAHK